MITFALRNLMSRPVRSALSLLGLTVAIAGMVGLFAVKGGLEKTVDDTFRMIPGLTVMQPGAPVPIFSRLPADWETELEELDGVGVVNPQLIQRANLIEGEMTFNPPRFLLGMEISSRLKLERDVYEEHLVAGRYLRAADAGTVNCVVSRQIADHFQKGVGDVIDADGFTYPIVGIYETSQPLLDVAILVDIGRLREVSRIDRNIVSLFYLEKSDPELSDDVLKRRIRDKFRGRSIDEWRPGDSSAELALRTGNPLIDALLRLLQTLLPATAAPKTAPDNASASAASMEAVEVRTGDDWATRIQEFSEDLDLFLGIMTGIGMTIALLSIINTMLMSVTERIIEFGILKANGWTPGDVLKLITLESGLIGLLGGILGAVSGWGVTLALNAVWPEKLHLFAGPGLLAFSVAFAAAVGVLGGLYPAVWAMRMMPMDAIRRG